MRPGVRNALGDEALRFLRNGVLIRRGSREEGAVSLWREPSVIGLPLTRLWRSVKDPSLANFLHQASCRAG